ncbi:N-acetylneuraminate lyase [Hypsibius exemplaris]|uniref:N-acetylneuraminate lyase n=1 Tax=Hypsibius exemplaris TaxID=2072580 RepID=A0A1W0WJ01_HYPEX|nr:N-acetylneuraminate lyase [Hypsibius exemplaris]
MDESDNTFYGEGKVNAQASYTRNDHVSAADYSLANLHGSEASVFQVPSDSAPIVLKSVADNRISGGSLGQTTSTTSQLIPKAARKRITDACVDFVIRDMRSYETVIGDGFIGLTNTLIELGQMHGSLPAADLLPHIRTISESIETRASYVRKKLVPELEHCIKENGAGVTLNFWTDVKNQRNYVGLTVHYFRLDSLVNRILITTEYDPDLRKDAGNVRKWTMDELALFGVMEELCHAHVIFVTDGSVNLVKAFNIPKRPAMRRLPCFAHLLNSVMSTAFDEENAPEGMTDVRAMIKESKMLVNHIKHTGLFHDMDAAIKHNVDTLWSTHYEMLSSILRQFETVNDLLVRRNEHDRMPGPREVMEELVDFLKLFKDAAEELSQTSKPTMHMVVPIILQLKQHCDQPSPSGCNAMKATKRRVKELMIEKIDFDILHKIACFLCPAFRTMRMFSLAEQNVILQEVRRRTTICVFGGGIGGIGASCSNVSDASLLQPGTKRQKMSSSFDFSNLAEPDTLTANVDEIKGYQDFRLTEQASIYQADPMRFWKEHEVMFPGLSKLARQILCVPAASTPGEMVFCRSGFVVNDRRNLLKPEKVNDILFLHMASSTFSESKSRSIHSPIHSTMAASRFDHKGLFVATFTPMKDNGDINPDVVPAYVDHLVRTGVNGVFVNGTAGEGLSMTVAERKLMAETWLAASKGKLKTIVHVGAVALRDAQELAAHAESLGADAIAAIPTFYFAPRTPVELATSLQSVAAAAPNTPFLYYHIPAMTRIEMDMSVFLTIAKAQIPTLSGVKYSGFDLSGASRCLLDHGLEFEVMWGRDDVMLGALAFGMKSFIGSSYNFTAPIAIKIIKAVEAGDFETARNEQKKLKKVMDLTERFGDLVSTFKALTAIAGVPVGPTRAPLRTINAKEMQKFRSTLQEQGCLEWLTGSD